jgi:hypothetical protein
MGKDLQFELQNSIIANFIRETPARSAAAVNYKIRRFHVVTKLNDRFDSPFTN